MRVVVVREGLMIRTVAPPFFGGQSGFTLLEVLIALLVLSIGLLGLAGLQAKGLRYNQSAYLRSVATAQAYNMADRIRANRAGASAGDYDNVSGLPSYTNCDTNACTPAQMAAFDVYQWNTDNKNALPSGQGRVTVQNANPRVLTVTVMWDDQRTGVTGTNCSGNPKVDLTCFSTSFRP